MKVIIAMIIILCVIIVSKAFQTSLCPIVKCHDPLKTEGTCFENTSENIYQYSFCKKNQFCPTNGLKSETKTCIPKENRQLDKERVEGQECYNSKDCASYLCNKFTCVGIKLDENCFNTQMCPIGYYCNRNIAKCEKQIAIGNQCQVDYECVNNAGCYEGHCLKYYSLDIGAKTQTSIFCKSNFISGKTVDLLRCAESKLIESDYECKGEQTQCRYSVSYGGSEPSEEISENCRCSYAYADKKFCPLDSAHELTKEYFEKKRNYYDGEALQNHHSFMRHKSNDKGLHTRLYEIANYPRFYQADKCALGFELGLDLKSQLLKLSIITLLYLFLL